VLVTALLARKVIQVVFLLPEPFQGESKSSFATWMMKNEMEKIDIPPVGEFLTMIHDAGSEIFACKATVNMFHLKQEDFCPEVDGVISVGQFYEKAVGGQIIFT
jgi:peroxiredoxin family protein